MNFLEELVAEWYGYTGYFVRRNIKRRKRDKGGYDNEIDVLAFSAKDKELIHIEPSGGADSWEKKKKSFLEKKFVYTKEEYEEIVGEEIKSIRKIALAGSGRSTKVDLNWGQGVEVVLIPAFIKEIATRLPDPFKEAVPEGYPLLRAIQFSKAFGGSRPPNGCLTA